MVKLIHARSGGIMWVAESRLEEYLGAGHKLASSDSVSEAVEAVETVEAVVEESPKPEVKKRKSRKKEG